MNGEFTFDSHYESPYVHDFLKNYDDEDLLIFHGSDFYKVLVLS